MMFGWVDSLKSKLNISSMGLTVAKRGLQCGALLLSAIIIPTVIDIPWHVVLYACVTINLSLINTPASMLVPHASTIRNSFIPLFLTPLIAYELMNQSGCDMELPVSQICIEKIRNNYYFVPDNLIKILYVDYRLDLFGITRNLLVMGEALFEKVKNMFFSKPEIEKDCSRSSDRNFEKNSKRIVEHAKSMLGKCNLSDVEVEVLDDNHFNASAVTYGGNAGKGQIGLNKGLFKYDDKQIYSVIAHEIGHLSEPSYARYYDILSTQLYIVLMDYAFIKITTNPIASLGIYAFSNYNFCIMKQLKEEWADRFSCHQIQNKKDVFGLMGIMNDIEQKRNRSSLMYMADMFRGRQTHPKIQDRMASVADEYKSIEENGRRFR